LEHFENAKVAHALGMTLDMEKVWASKLPVSPTDICDRVQDCEKSHVEAVVALIGLSPEVRETFREPLDVRKRTLFALPSEKLLLFDVSNAMDTLWGAFERVALSDSKFFDRRYAPLKGKWLEQEAAAYLGRVFPASSIAAGLRYPDPENPGGETELDCLVQWGPFLLLCESKSVRIRDRSLQGQLGPLGADIKKVIARPFAQANRARRYIEDTSNARFKKPDGSEIVIRRNQLARIYCVTISQHHLSGLSADMKQIQCIHSNEMETYPYSVCLADLDVITRFSEFPEVFFHYVVRRLELQKVSAHICADEHDLFLAYLSTRLLPGNAGNPDFGEPGLGGIAFDGLRGKVDVYFQWLRGETQEKPEICLDIPDNIHCLLCFLRERGDLGTKWAAISILDLPDSTLLGVAELMESLKTDPPAPSIYRTIGLQAGDVSVCIIGAARTQEDELCERTEIRTEVEKYRRKTSTAIGISFLCSSGELMLHSVVWRDEPWHEDRQLAELSAGIRGTIPLGVKAPPRNAPCPCGSGKKFKACCLARYESMKQRT